MSTVSRDVVVMQSQSSQLPQPMYTRAQARQRLNMGPRALATCVSQGHLQKVLVGTRHVVYYQAEVDAVVDVIRVGIQRSYALHEVMTRLQMSQMTVYEHVAAGRLHTVAVPAQPTRYQRDEVDALLVQRQAWLAQYTAVAPQEAMTYTDALTFLRMDAKSFYQHVASGAVQLVTMAGRKRGYQKADVQALAQRLQQGRAVAEDTYSRAQACQVLGLTPNGFEHHVLLGRVRRTTLPGSRLYGYVKTDVEALLQFQARTAPCVPNEAVYTQFYTQFERPAMKYLGYRGIPLLDAQDIFQTVMADLWEYGASFFAAYPTFPEQLLKGYGRLRWALIALKSAPLSDSLEQQSEGLGGHPALQLRARQPSVEQEVIARLEIEQVRAYCQQHFPAVVCLIVELAAMGYGGKGVLLYLREHHGLDLSLVTVERWRGHAFKELRAQLS